MNVNGCQACRIQVGDAVLDLGYQPPSDYFSLIDDPVPDPVYLLRINRSTY
jgi:hypothetical protein